MNPILFTAAKGAERVMYAQEVRANNLAHTNTVGFKSLIEFSSPMPVGGSGFQSSVTTRTNSATNNFQEGTKVNTQRDLDVAITGSGFFTLEGEGGKEVYTRAGDFHLDSDGNLMRGPFAVIGENGPIQVPENQKVQISDDGFVSIIPVGGGASLGVDQLKLVNPEVKTMTLDRSGQFVSTTGQNLPMAEDVTIKTGFLESSNVSGTEELVSIMSLSRQYEMQVKVMAAANEISKIGNKIIQG